MRLRIAGIPVIGFCILQPWTGFLRSPSPPLRRARVLAFLDRLKPCLVGTEACSTSHYWARELTRLGFGVRLIPLMYVKPHVKPGSPTPSTVKRPARPLGDQYLRQLLVAGMTPLVRQTKPHQERPNKWLAVLRERNPARLETVVLVNKTARIVWAVLTKYEPHTLRTS